MAPTVMRPRDVRSGRWQSERRSVDLGTPKLVVMMKTHDDAWCYGSELCSYGVMVVAVREARGRGSSGSSGSWACNGFDGDLEERKRRRRLVSEQSAAGAA
ncbi:hypothetical protein M0R45_016501 [Rubus argutus]|uniref:Uncharacterized protein n=1 Tax=Rubus argutus TaxID=59490 RepID=A0AAW1XTS1_RUBAR